MLARWGIPQLLGLRNPPHGAPWDPSSVAADLFLYVLYNRTVGPRVLKVSGDENSDALVYAHCAKVRRGDYFGGILSPRELNAEDYYDIYMHRLGTTTGPLH